MRKADCWVGPSVEPKGVQKAESLGMHSVDRKATHWAGETVASWAAKSAGMSVAWKAERWVEYLAAHWEGQKVGHSAVLWAVQRGHSRADLMAARLE